MSTDLPERSPWSRLRRMGAPRATRANVLATLLALLLGFGIATQVQQTQQGGLEQLRQEDLVSLLDDISQRSARLDAQIRDLESDRETLRSGVGSSAAAVAQAQARLDSLGILAGTLTAEGPGIRMTIEDSARKVTATTLLDVVEELRDAGAEVIQIGAARVVASTWLGDSGGDVQVDGTRVERPFMVLAIGDAATMTSAMNIPGGVVDTVRQLGASTSIASVTTLAIDALHSAQTPRYAQAVPESVPSTPASR
ncbi:MAG TPA: DUF881 domain-containing protein [Candidatus Lustribacter sp.]|nr:DUF881 domain-containing protein [Candidatus Lustribacter sp.]